MLTMTELQKKSMDAAFGTKQERFENFGVHPGMNTAGIAYTQYDIKLGPGWYETGTSTLTRPSTGPGWNRRYETMKMSKIPHILYREEWLKTREQKRKFAPGMYDHDKFGTSQLNPNFQRGMLDSRGRRFGVEYPSKNPGPGTYGEGGIPDAEFQRRKDRKVCRVGLMDAGHRDRSCKLVGSHLPPGAYESKGFTEIIKRKVTSLRGPYDCFSTERADYKIGHRAVQTNPLGPGQYDDNHTFLAEWKKNPRKYHGRFLPEPKVEHHMPGHDRIFNSTLAQCPRKPIEPSPDQYNVLKRQAKPFQRRVPFIHSAVRYDGKFLRSFRGGCDNTVGVGRYELDKNEKNDKHHGFQSAFKARNRFGGAGSERIARDRKRFKEIEAEQRGMLLSAPGPKSNISLQLQAMKNT